MSQTIQTVHKPDVFELVTNQIIESLEKGVVPWKKTWTLSGLPQNLVTRKAYRGINVLLLAQLGYPLNFFLTFQQVQKLRGHIRKGEKGHIVVFVKRIEDRDEQTQEKVWKSFLRYYKVFNILQTEGITESKIPTVNRPNDPIRECEFIIGNMPNRPVVRTANDDPYYEPLGDFISMPPIGDFKSSQGYYETLFHELIHSTGHKSRLNREGVAGATHFGSEPYSAEELVAEIGACLLKSHVGFDEAVGDNSAAYIQGWMKKLKDDRKFIIYASSQAQHAVDFILNIVPEMKSESTKEEVS